jgi:uncharacterized membrane protein YphA (DoxX/SURF4 family)
MITTWILRVLVAALFLLAAFMKLSGKPQMIEEFQTIGLGQAFRFVTGAIELIGGLLVLVPAVSVFGAILLLLVDIGAFIAQIAILHMDFIHTIVIGAVIGLLIYLQRHRLGA